MSALAGFHLHLYQPPRENPWLGEVPVEPSAWPYRDWNERITEECYRALSSVVLGVDVAEDTSDGLGAEIVEPLASSSFDVGATLHRWFDHHALDVDTSIRRQGARGSALGAPFVHAILPLATRRDKEILVAWGIADHRARFGAAPRGFWLPETAVDLETLEVLYDAGLEFTILMPGQAARVRAPGGRWRTVDAVSLDTSAAYRVALGPGRTLTVVFGHGPLSQRVAFDEVLNNGEALASSMLELLGLGEKHLDPSGSDGTPGDVEPGGVESSGVESRSVEGAGAEGAVLVVADGETYGHHHRFGDLALAWAVRRLGGVEGVTTELDHWLDEHPAEVEVELRRTSAWSCAHGVERWRSDCGCSTGSEPGWNQAWRTPLRDALDWLRARLGQVVDDHLARLVDSPFDTVVSYGEVLAGTLDPAGLLRRHGLRPLDAAETVEVLELCEVHRNLLCSFTSCAWFFAEPFSIETLIVLRYAAVALESAARLCGLDVHDELARRLEPIRSNLPGGVTGPDLLRLARADRFDERRLAAGFAAEHAAHGAATRSVRGYWRAEWVVDADEHLVRLSHVLTGRQVDVEVTLERRGLRGLAVEAALLGEEAEPTRFELGDLGADVIARVATAWLLGAGSDDAARSLEQLVAELGEGRTDPSDPAVLCALAGAARCASPASEASVRRALLQIAPSAAAPDEDLAALARAVGLEQLAERFSARG